MILSAMVCWAGLLSQIPPGVAQPLGEDSLSPAATGTGESRMLSDTSAFSTTTWEDFVTIEGEVDTYYSWFLSAVPRTPSSYRLLDKSNGTFSLAYAELSLEMAPQPVGFRFDLGFGEVAEATASAPANVFKYVKQGYASFNLPFQRNITVDVGKFVTTAGAAAEVIDSRHNWNYSHSLLFTYSNPFTHTGIRVNAALTRALNLQASLVNGWDVVADNNASKTFGLSLQYALPHNFTAVLTVYAGPEGNSSKDWRTLVDLVVAKTLSERFSVNLSADYATENAGHWYGVAARGHWTVNDLLRLSVRGEYMGDPHLLRLALPGSPGLGATDLVEFTGTAAVPVGRNGEFRFEIRRDEALASLSGSRAVFSTGTFSGPSTGETTLQFAAMAWF